jgi:preprotein translocase subunit SecE
MNNWLSSARQFLADTLTELRKCSWPGRQELFESTLVVIAAIIVLSVYVALLDEVCRVVINFITMN